MIFYWYGENSFAITAQVRALTLQYQKKTGGSLEIENFDMSAQPLSNLLNSLAVMPMFASSRLLIVREFGQLKLDKTKLESMLNSVSDTTVLVIIDSKPDRRSVIFKTLSHLEKSKEFKNLSQPQLTQWVKLLVEKEGGEIDNRTTLVLIEKVGFSQWQLRSEIQKLVNYSPEISLESINALVVPNVEYSAFAMTDAIARGQVAKAIEIYHQLVAQKEPDQKILGAIVYQYRTLALSKMHEGESGAWTKKFGVAPYAAQKAQNLSRNMTIQQIQKSYNAIVEADMDIKTGQMDSNGAMEELIIKLARK